MKTSFYFVVWIVIYPILGLFHSQAIDNNAFIIALLAVWGLSWWLNKMMPKTLQYEFYSQTLPMLENIYTGNISAFTKNLARETRVEILSSFYFLVATVAMAYAVFKFGANEWIALGIFGLFALSTIAHSLALNKELIKVKKDPTAEQCAESVAEIYKIDYYVYQETRSTTTYEAMLPPRPAHFKAFQIFSIVIAGICALLGCFYILMAVGGLIANPNLALSTFLMMYFLYGSLAAYYGIKDFVSIFRNLKGAPKENLINKASY